MADEPKQQPGLKLPMPGSGDTPPREAPQTGGGPPATTATEMQPQAEAETSVRDTAIGGGVFLVLMVACVFAKNAYTIFLVGRKVAPRSANLAGWWLFFLLTSFFAGFILAFVHPGRFLTILFVVPMVVVMLIFAVLMIISSRR